MRSLTHRLRHALTQVFASAAANLDARDAHFYGGLAIAFAGAARLSTSWALVALGVVLALVGLRGSR